MCVCMCLFVCVRVRVIFLKCSIHHRSVVFHPDGACIFGGSTELLKVYGWEPSRCFDSVNMSWGKVADMAIAQTQLVSVVTFV